MSSWFELKNVFFALGGERYRHLGPDDPTYYRKQATAATLATRLGD
jgi:hypothetical protein